jgi:hypothetical protein
MGYTIGLSCPLANGKYDQEIRGKEKREVGCLFPQLPIFPANTG